MLAGPWERVEYTRRPRPCRPQLPAEHLQGLGPQTQASQVVSSLLAVLGAGTLEVRVGETHLEQVSRDGAGEKGRRLIRKWQAGLSIVFFSRLDYKPGGAGAMVGKGRQDPRAQQALSGQKWWRTGWAFPASTRPVGDSSCQVGTSEQQGWRRPDHHSIPFGVPVVLNRPPSNVSVPSHVGRGLAEGIRALV